MSEISMQPVSSFALQFVVVRFEATYETLCHLVVLETAVPAYKMRTEIYDDYSNHEDNLFTMEKSVNVFSLQPVSSVALEFSVCALTCYQVRLARTYLYLQLMLYL